jgi:hypothetical protein
MAVPIAMQAAAVVALVLQATIPVLAENRQPAGGAFMNSYTTDPYFDPKSFYSQNQSPGDVGGQPLLVEPSGTPPLCLLFAISCVRPLHGSREGRR